jgi:hypothetical protein
MRTKKYWQALSEQHYRDLQEALNLSDLRDQALRFLLKSPDTYRVELTSDVQVLNSAPYSKPITRFEYVDQNGKYHRHCRPVSIDTLEIISTNAETAVLRFETLKNKYTYWILNKADETVAEIPEELFCHRNTKICEIKETNNANNEINA